MPFKSKWEPLQIPKCNILSYLFPKGGDYSEAPLWIDAANPSNNFSQLKALSLIRQFAVGLEKHGILPGQVIMVFTVNQIYVPPVYLAVAGSKRIFTGVNPNSTVAEVAYQMKTVEASIVLVHPSLLDTALAAAKQANIDTARLFTFSETEPSPSRGIRHWRELLATPTESKSWDWDPLDNEAAVSTVAAINFSSGTTGLPKGVCISHHNIVANAEQNVFNRFIGEETGRHDEAWLAFLPLYHAYGQLWSITIGCRLHISVYIMAKFVYEDFMRCIEKFKITALQAVPPVLVMLLKRPETAKYDTSSLEHIISGAAPLAGDVQNEVSARLGGVIIAQGWGMTETTCAGILIPGMRTMDRTGSIGFLLPNTEGMLVDDDDKEVTEDGKPGELWLRGPQIMIGYWRNEKATRDTKTED